MSDRKTMQSHAGPEQNTAVSAPGSSGDSDSSFLAEEDLAMVARLLQRDAAAWQNFALASRGLIISRIRAAAAELHQPQLQEETLEDLIAEVYRELLNREMAVLRQYSGRSRLSTFLAIIVRRTTLRLLLRTARQTALSMPAEDDEFAMVNAEDRGLRQQQTEQLQLAMLRLSPDDQRLLQLFYFEQQDYAQIAREFRLQVNSVGPRLDRARRRLRRLMQTEDDS
ncbi:MAG: RNA polymerase sigma factor [Planctomycetota bacterium]